MTGWLGEAYLYVKAAHVVFMIFWMAGLFALPRFFAYHQEAKSGTSEWRAWSVREDRIIRYILQPAAVATWAAGLALVTHLGESRALWFVVKFGAVALLTGYHWWMVGYARRFVDGRALVSNRAMRLLNEVPALLIVIAVAMVIIRPY